MAGSSIIVKTTDMLRSGQEVEERRRDYVCVLAFVDTTAPKSLVLPVRDAFDPRMPSAGVRVVAAGSGTDLLAPSIPDVCVAVLGRNERAIVAGVCELAAAGVPVALVVESALDAVSLPLGETARRRVSTIAATSSEVLLERLAEWLIDATDKSIAFAANFPFCRKAKVRALINESAMETMIGAAKLGPGAELPSMAVNQARLALTIAAVNGRPLEFGRVPEVLSAVGAGFGSRMFANKALGKIPVVGWLFEAGFGYLGTQATGRTLQHRFDKRDKKAEATDGIVPTKASSASSTIKSGSRRIADAVRARVSKREGTVVASDAATEVRLLTNGDEGGFLVYDQEPAQ